MTYHFKIREYPARNLILVPCVLACSRLYVCWGWVGGSEKWLSTCSFAILDYIEWLDFSDLSRKETLLLSRITRAGISKIQLGLDKWASNPCLVAISACLKLFRFIYCPLHSQSNRDRSTETPVTRSMEVRSRISVLFCFYLRINWS